MNNLTLKQLEVFIVVVDSGSFTDAANSLYLAQSTVSSHIQSLEQVLGIPLFNRVSTRRVELNENGKRVYNYAKEIIEKVKELETGVACEISREIVIGASTLPSQSIVPSLVSEFMISNPDYYCEIKNGDTEKLHEMLRSGEVQLGFVGAANDRKNIVYEKIAEDKLVMIAPNTPQYAAYHAAGRLGHDMLGDPLVFRELGSATQRTIDNYLAEVNCPTDSLNVVARVSSPDALKEMVANGVGLSIIPDALAKTYVDAGKVLQFELEEHPVARNIYMAYSKFTPLGRGARFFMKFVREKMK